MTPPEARGLRVSRAHLRPVHWYVFDDATTVCGKALERMGGPRVRVTADSGEVTCRNCKRTIHRRRQRVAPRGEGA